MAARTKQETLRWPGWDALQEWLIWPHACLSPALAQPSPLLPADKLIVKDILFELQFIGGALGEWDGGIAGRT